MKYCPSCNKEKDYSEFSKNKRQPDGYQSWCKQCGSDYNRQYRRNHLIEHRKYANDYAKNNPDIIKNIRICRKYGITLDEFNSLIRIQNNKCLICYKEMIGTDRHIDHDHITKRVRGLLCGRCNNAIGFLKDSPYSAINVTKYLIENNSRGIDYVNSPLWGGVTRKLINNLLEVATP